MAEEIDDNQNVRVMTRVRLFNQREIDISKQKKELLRSVVKMRGKTCAVVENYLDARGFPCERERQAFDFDECFWSIPKEQDMSSAMPFADQRFVYERSGLLGLNWALTGFNVCLFAYGQTGSGKTYSMLGSHDDPGICPRLVDELFSRIKTNIGVKTMVECMFFEIYNENVQDLFNKRNTGKPDFKPPKIRQHPIKGVYVDGLQRKEVTTAEQTKRYMERGSNERAAGETKMNAHSSRSHAIFQLQVTQIDVMKGTQRVSTINLIDLAGSEKIKQSQAKDERLKEATNINLSLTTLRRVIDVLIENSKIKNPKNWKHAPYRESILTYVLSDSLGGNSKTMMIATISPHENNIEDTLNTLQYALRAKSIVCAAKVNEEQSKMVLDTMRDEILKLREQIENGTGGGGSPEANAEILHEIELREAEVAKIEESAKQMEEELKKEKEEKQEMQTEMQVQKRERFAAAFRNAFLISTEKKKQEHTFAELEALTKQKRELDNELIITRDELEGLKVEFADHVQLSESKIDSLTRELNSKDAALAQTKRQIGNLNDENKFLKTQNAALTNQGQAMESLKSELEQRIQRLQEEVLSLTTTGERERAERSAEQKAHSEELLRLTEDIENLRRRKDKYKLTAMESRAKAEAVQSVVNALKDDRTAFLATIKAQQGVVEEQSSVVKRYAVERRDADRKLQTLERQVTTKDDDLRVMNEALREYQNASTEFIYENHNIHRELDRLQRQNEHIRGSFESPRRAITSGPNASSISPMNSMADVSGVGSGNSSGLLGASPRSMGTPTRTHVDPYAQQYSGSRRY